MLSPKKTKHRKWHQQAGTSGNQASRLTNVDFGSFGLKATTASWITSRQIEATRRVIVRYIRKGGKIWIRIFPDKPVTTKGAETPMGKGKGAPDHFVVDVKPGTIMFEIDGIPEDKAREALTAAAHKLPVKCKVVGK
ncbi:50S ribosomal protein L16 [Candidatus Parcubacteria bacterium]|nr:50S ribosomal protein L16 [Patescibacteria group bacterium]MBU4482135.1 50S ribosomal protein L16 [Patescibacteria group bacterium]MCG2687066.1 50S ribosomal protein L16 [Candidatus Parcubacteria bacterium]